MSDLTLSQERPIFFEDHETSNIIFSIKKIIFAAARVNIFFVTRGAGNKPIIFLGLAEYIFQEQFSGLQNKLAERFNLKF